MTAVCTKYDFKETSSLKIHQEHWVVFNFCKHHRGTMCMHMQRHACIHLHCICFCIKDCPTRAKTISL